MSQQIIKIIFHDGSEIEYKEQPLEYFSKYSMASYLFRTQHKDWLENIVLPKFPSDLEDWAKDKYDLINRRHKKNIEDFSDREIQEQFEDRCLKPNLIKHENIINQDFISRIVEITERGDNAEIDKVLESLEKTYRIK